MDSTYISSATAAQILVYSTCQTTQEQLLSATSPTLIKALPNGTGAVAVDPPSIDVVSTPSTLNAGCPVTTQSTINGYDLGVGSFTPAQLLVSPNSSTAFILSNLPSVITFNVATLAPSTIPLAGGATPLYGGLTIDGTQLWVGASDNNGASRQYVAGTGRNPGSGQPEGRQRQCHPAEPISVVP